MNVRAFVASGIIGVFALTGCASTGQAAAGESSAGQSAATDEVTLYIVRHGKTMLNTTDRVQGWSDAVLTPAGEEVVHAAGRGLKDVPFQSAYSSDLGRARQTAKIILSENSTSKEVALQDDDRLREFNFGTYEGDLNHTMWSDIAKLRGISLDEFLKNPDPESFANSVATLDAKNKEANKNWPAEDYKTITARLTASAHEIVKKEAAKGNGNVLVVSHGLSIQALLDSLFPDFKAPEGGLANASVTVVKYKDGKYTLDKINDTSYAESGAKSS